MTHSTLRSLAAALLCTCAGHVAAAGLTVAADTNDQIARTVHAADLSALTASLERAPIAVSWTLDPSETLTAHPVPFVRDSREYWLDASEAQMRSGVRLPTTAAEALIRISPHADNATLLDTDALFVRHDGRQFTAREASHGVVDAEALRRAGMDVPNGTVVMKLDAALGNGEFELAAPSATGSYLIHVFEPTSAQVLSLTTTRDGLVAGETLIVNARLAGATARLVRGVVSAPDGHVQPIEFAALTDGTLQARVTPDAAHAGGPGLWEVHAFADASAGRLRVLRDAKTAFAVARPTARLDGSAWRSDRGGAVALRIGVEVASASRYQLAGVLYATAQGKRVPIAHAHSAKWLEAGRTSIELRFDADVIAKAGLQPPYELRDLRLFNQADMSLIERRAVAFELR